LASLSDMSRVEKEECVIRLYKENKSTREIAKIMHMSFGRIAAITKKVKLEADRERGQLEEDDDIKSKSKTTQAIKLFSELKTPVEVAIALDVPADQAQAICLEYWKLDGMYRLAEIYEEAKYDLHDVLRLHRIVKDLGMEKQDIINALELVKQNQLQTLESKVQNLRYQINLLEAQKRKYMDHIFNLKRMIRESEETLAQKRGEMAYLNRETRKLRQRIIDYNSHNLRPTDSERDANSDSTEIVPYNKE
jgi:transposase